MQRQRVVIVGGGLAGLAAASALGARGIACELLESRPRLGGRASSFQDTTTGDWIDNCQHVAMGCCTNFLDFCRRTGLADYFEVQPALYFIGPNGRVHRFAEGPWPAPLHLAGAFARLSYLSGSDKRALARGLRALARGPSIPGETFAAWLSRHNQPLNAVRYFWRVVLVSALSESLDRISVPAARKVLLEGFLSHRQAWRVSIPTVPLEELYGGRLTAWLTSQQVNIRLLTAAERLEVNDGRVRGVRLKSGELVEGDQFILAVPWHRLKSLLPESLAADPQLGGIDQLQTAPISSLHLWFDRPVTDSPHAVFVDGLSQWLFRRGPCYYQVVISASRDVVERDSESVRQEVLQELTCVWPAVNAATVIHSRLVTEHKAVFSPLPGIDALRPVQQSPITNLQFAGDWTQTGWPATMESAVRSGYLAAENVLRHLGQPAVLLQPDLPPARLYCWFFRNADPVSDGFDS